MKKDMKTNRNTRVLAENTDKKHGFIIYLDFSGKRECLMYHRHNSLLYNFLKDGMAVDDIRRWKPSQIGGRASRGGTSQLCDMVGHLVAVIDDYLIEREAS